MKFKIGPYDMELIHHDPKVYTVNGVISEEECEHFKKITFSHMQRSTVSSIGKSKVKGLLDNRRTSSNCWVKHKYDKITLDVASRIAELIQIPLDNAEDYQVLHYESAQEYQPHLDTFDPKLDKKGKYLSNGGQRIITVLGYLNTVEEGGETSFPNIDKAIFPETGKIVVFHNCIDGTNRPHPDSLHGACPVIQGEKWAFNLWFREKARSRNL
jgi:prolyl 4-hydroxylase